MNLICHCSSIMDNVIYYNANDTNIVSYKCLLHYSRYHNGNFIVLNKLNSQLLEYRLSFPNKKAQIIGNITTNNSSIDKYIGYQTITTITNIPFVPLYAETYLQQAEYIIDKILKLKTFI